MKSLTLAFFALLVFSAVALTYRNNGDELTWETNFATAVEKAKKQKKKLLINFTGSDWCGWCIKLDQEVFSKEDFITYANKNFVCIKLDFPKRKKLSTEESTQNQKLAVQYKVKGFPTILVLDNDEALLMQTGYQFGGAQTYIDHLEAGIKPTTDKK